MSEIEAQIRDTFERLIYYYYKIRKIINAVNDVNIYKSNLILTQDKMSYLCRLCGKNVLQNFNYFY